MKWRVNIVDPKGRASFSLYESNLMTLIASGELVIGPPHETKTMYDCGYTTKELVSKGLVGVYNPNLEETM
jgi:hypothetical protein